MTFGARLCSQEEIRREAHKALYPGGEEGGSQPPVFPPFPDMLRLVADKVGVEKGPAAEEGPAGDGAPPLCRRPVAVGAPPPLACCCPRPPSCPGVASSTPRWATGQVHLRWLLDGACVHHEAACCSVACGVRGLLTSESVDAAFQRGAWFLLLYTFPGVTQDLSCLVFHTLVK